jgi:RNA polymerase sigma-70 factor (ECF subfamily)
MHTGAVVIESAETENSELISRARAGDLESFDQIMILHQRRVFRTALRILGNLQDAQDAAQDVFLRLFKYINKLDPARELSPWLYRVTVNVCHDIARKRRKTTELPEIADSSSVVNTLDLDAEVRMLSQALQALPEKERAAIVLRDVEGLSTKEVAGILGSTETNSGKHPVREQKKTLLPPDNFCRRFKVPEAQKC